LAWIWTIGTTSTRPVLPVETGTTGRAWPVLPVGSVPNLTLRFQTDLFLD
jgi:hypothetical protein